MNPDNTKLESLAKEVSDQRAMLEQIYISVEKTRKYFLWSMIGTIVVFVLPLIALAVVLPAFMNTYSSYLSGAGLGL